MLALFSALIASAPTAVVFGRLAWANRRERLRRDVLACQIALTEAVHERLGPVAAPMLCRHRRGWQVRIAVRFERPAVTEALLATVLEAFPPLERDPRSLEIILTRQTDASARKPARAHVGRESLSWT